MKSAIRPFAVAVLAATSALASPPAPAIAAVSSPALAVHAPQLRFEDGVWRLSGCVAPSRETPPPLATHLDVVCLDSVGAPVAAEVVPLKTSALRHRVRAPRPHIRYSLPPDFVSPATVRIEVRADSGTNHQP